MAPEKMNIEEPSQETPEPKEVPEVKTENPDAEVASLLKELEGLGINSPEKARNVVHASQQAGQAWNEVGRLRNEVNRLTEALQSTQQQYKQQDDTYYQEQQFNPNTIKKVMDEWYGERILGPQRQAMEAYMRDMQEVQSDPDYQSVSGIWEKHLQNPRTQQSIQSGQTTIGKEYDRLVRTYQREMLKRSHTTISGLASKLNPKPQHVERGDSQASMLPPQTDEERKEKTEKLVNRRTKGEISADKALESMIKDMLPADDPIWRM